MHQGFNSNFCNPNSGNEKGLVENKVDFYRRNLFWTNYPGERVQIDVKYVLNKCIDFASYHSRYYQITAIDKYSRKRYLELVNELSTYSTSNF